MFKAKARKWDIIYYCECVEIHSIYIEIQETSVFAYIEMA